ncbi:TetR/AcrR family transcriptional regulator [soil metagenome]
MAPRTAKQFVELRRKSREKIIEAATEIFAKQGFHGTSISDIATKAKVSKGLMYNYFKSKEELIDAIMEGGFKEFDQPMAAMQLIADPHEKLHMLIEGSFAMVKSKKDRRHWQFLISIMTQQEVMKRMQKNFMKYFKMYMGIFEQLFVEMDVPDPKLETYRLAAMLDGVMLHYVNIFTKDYPLEAMKNEILLHYEKYRKKK